MAVRARAGASAFVGASGHVDCAAEVCCGCVFDRDEGEGLDVVADDPQQRCARRVADSLGIAMPEADFQWGVFAA